MLNDMLEPLEAIANVSMNKYKEITITELPIGNRSDELPLRFRLTPAAGGLPRWGIVYHVSRFENT
jgi:hypothetical protein